MAVADDLVLAPPGHGPREDGAFDVGPAQGKVGRRQNRRERRVERQQAIGTLGLKTPPEGLGAKIDSIIQAKAEQTGKADAA